MQVGAYILYPRNSVLFPEEARHLLSFTKPQKRLLLVFNCLVPIKLINQIKTAKWENTSVGEVVVTNRMIFLGLTVWIVYFLNHAFLNSDSFFFFLFFVSFKCDWSANLGTFVCVLCLAGLSYRCYCITHVGRYWRWEKYCQTLTRITSKWCFECLTLHRQTCL